jgi:hypothetical protein
MYSLVLIIFVVSEKKAFEHFPIGSNVNLCPISSFISETTGPIGTKLSRNVPWVVLYKVSVFRSSRIFNMAARANIGFNVNLCPAVVAILDFRSAYKTEPL